MLQAIDRSFRIILATNAFYSSADRTHDAMMNICTNRFGQQIETVSTEHLLDSWSDASRLLARS